MECQSYNASLIIIKNKYMHKIVKNIVLNNLQALCIDVYEMQINFVSRLGS